MIPGTQNSVASLVDISERRRAEDELRASEEKFSKTFQSSPDLILLSSIPDTKILEVNDSVLKITGYSREEILGSTVIDLNLWADDSAREQYKTLVRKEGTAHNFEAVFRKKNGDLITGLISGAIISLESGPCFISVVRDITERKHNEEALREWERRIKIIGESIPGAVYQFELSADGQYHIPFVAGKWENFAGVTAEEAMHSVEAVFASIHPDDIAEFKQTILRSAHTLEPWVLEFRTIVNGTVHRVLGRSMPEKPRPDGSILWNGVLIEITDKKQAEK